MRRFFFLVFFVGLPAGAAHATTFIEIPFPDLVKEAPTVVRGKIGTSSTDWVTGEDASKRIFTFYQFQVEETFKGDVTASNIHIREMGGEKEGMGMQVAGAAQFAQGEDVVVFLGPQNRDGSYDVRGLSSGKFNLQRQDDGKICLSGIGLARAGRDGFVHAHENGADHGTDHSDAASDCEWNVDSLRSLIHSQGDSPAVSRGAPPVKSPAASPSVISSGSKLPAPQLQSSPAEETRSDARGQLWIVVLALGLAGLLAVLLMKPKQ
jgi:hypothetical protein